MSKTLEVTLVGQTPVLMHRFPMDGEDTSKLSPEEQAEKSTYRNAEGQLAFPSENIVRGLITAGKQIKKAGSGKATLSSTIACAVVPASTEYVLLDSKDQPVTKFEVHAKPVRIKATGGRIIRYRPMIRDWKLPVQIIYNETLITEKSLREAFEKLGQLVGIGDWRPECKGSYGVATLQK